MSNQNRQQRNRIEMNFAHILSIFLSIAAGQRCKLPSGGEGYCRQKSDCFASYFQPGCPNGLYCCQNTDKSIKKCKEYGKYVFKENYKNSLLINAKMHKESECQIESVPLIVGGVKATPKEFPHMAAIGYGENSANASWLCGGSLISERFVLSAAHCVDSGGRGKAKFVRLKTLNVQNPENQNYQDLNIEESIVHPNYNGKSQYNDIVLFKLSKPVRIDGFGRPACLHTVPDETANKSVIATGWGKLTYDDASSSKDLMKVTLKVIDPAVCKATYPPGFKLPRGIIESQVCAGELEGGKDTCTGDSGGPLQILAKEPYCMYSIVGITSFGKFCGYKNSPAVYTRVSYFVPWIESIVWP